MLFCCTIFDSAICYCLFLIDLSYFSCNLSHREELLPMADLVTPNLKEASMLLGGMHLETVADMRSAAKLIHDLGPR